MQVDECRRKYRSLLRTAPKRALYVFEFASAEGAADHNKPLARERAKKSIRTLTVLAAATVVAAMQLPPDIQADRHLVAAEKQIQEQNFEAAKASMDRILALEAEHGLQLPAEFYFRYAEVSDRLGLSQTVVDFLTKYLTLAGQDGEHYREALEMLNEAEAVVEAVKRVAEAAKNAIAEMEFVWVPAGEFRMGSTSSEAGDSEQPVTRVRISRGYWLGKYEVTQAEWQAVMGSNPSEFSGCGNCPVDTVSWDDVQGFIRRLNTLSGGTRYRLPTEAEWEYAARAGTSGDRYGNLDAIAWYDENSGDRPHPVGRKAPNAWGLYDMLGNVWEWVADWYGDYPGGSVTDPRGPGSGSGRVLRGGSWSSYAGDCRAPNRVYASPGYRVSRYGFRLLRTE